MKDTKLIAIAATSINGVIGVDNDIPWRIPEDFKHFRETTMGHALLVGYNTFLTLPSKAFEGRTYIVLNSEMIADQELSNNIYKFKRLDDVFEFIYSDDFKFEKVFLAGGAMMYDSLIYDCDEAIISWVDKIIPEGNKFFPLQKLITNFDAADSSEWLESKTGINYKIVHYTKK